MDHITLIKAIQNAFDGVQLGNGISLREARLHDDSETDPKKFEQARALDDETRWFELTKAEIEEFGDTLPFMDAEGYKFYLPAFMIYALQNPKSESVAADWTIYSLESDRLQRFHVFNEKQKRVIRLFLEYCANDDYHYDAEEADKALRYWSASKKS